MAAFGKPLEPSMASQAFATGPTSSPAVLASLWTPTVRRNWRGYGASLLFHVAAMGIAGLIGLSLPAEPALPALDSAWSDAELPVEWVSEVEPIDNVTSPDPGGRMVESSVTLLDDEPPRVRSVERPLHTAYSPLDVQAVSWSTSDLLTPAGDARRSSGQGTGAGDGVGDGKGFFGVSPAVGQKIVYVVDNSRSMNHPHDSEAKTRFRRLKVELIQSIWKMPPEQQFYVIFFNNETYAMPATTMQPATLAAKEKYLAWVATMDANGAPTDPRQAIGLALKFQPDVIYFLTDGEFDKIVNRKLLRIKQQRTTIHTFAFGEKIGEAVLDEFARNNQGKYTFIP